MFFAIVCAAVLTAVITGGYIAIKAAVPAPTQSAPSPIGSLVDSIKGTVSDSNMSNQQTQVIDASQTSDQNNVPVAASTANDESNPFVDQATQNQIQNENSQTQTQ